MTVQLTVRAKDGLRKWVFDEWQCLVAVASVSAQPESLAEFFVAIRRYQPAHDWPQTGSEVNGVQDAATTDGDWCLIDLASRSVVSGPHFELPERRSALQAEGDEHGDGSNVIWLDTPSDWLFETAAADWNTTIGHRVKVIDEESRLDFRAVLYGTGMLRCVADRILIAAASGVSETQRYEVSRRVHADWLMTARDDLSGKTPRELMLKNHEHLGWDLQHRSQQWLMQGFAAPPLDVSSVAYCNAAFGTTEIVIYFDLLRSLLDECWRQTDAGVMDGDEMAERLAGHLKAFLDRPPEESGGGLSCRELIECERRRMPVTGEQTHLDCDCPICQASVHGEFGSGPMFMAFDGHHLELEDEFAFSMIESRDDWERQQADDRCRMAEFQRQQSMWEESDEESDSAWQLSSVDWNKVLSGSGSLLSAPMALGFPLAELITKLKKLKKLNADQTHVDSLNWAFTALRSADDLAAAVSAAEEFRRCLQNAATEFPELTSKSADLQSRTDEILRMQKQRIAEANASQPLPALLTTTPVLNVVVFRAPGPSDDEAQPVSAEHTRTVSPRPLGGGLGYLTLDGEDFDLVADGISAGDFVGTATAVLHFMGPKAADLIQQPQDLDYCWTVTDHTPFERVLMLQVVMRPHLLE